MSKRVSSLLLVVLLLVSATAVSGQECELGECVAGMCSPTGECVGTPLTGGSCTLFSPCMTNGRCVDGACVGDPLPNGTPCGDPGCTGMCLAQFGFAFCIVDPATEGRPCSDRFGACTTNDRCQATFCLGDFIPCPDDGDPCTQEFCSPETERCESFSPCNECQTCNPSTGLCEADVGGPTRTPTSPVARTATSTITRTATAGSNTPTIAPATATIPRPTATLPMAGECVADCNSNRVVSIDEAVFATRIALGFVTLAGCESADLDGDGFVTIEELVEAVRALLAGCIP